LAALSTVLSPGEDGAYFRVVPIHDRLKLIKLVIYLSPSAHLRLLMLASIVERPGVLTPLPLNPFELILTEFGLVIQEQALSIDTRRHLHLLGVVSLSEISRILSLPKLHLLAINLGLELLSICLSKYERIVLTTRRLVLAVFTLIL
jgi:hypothetical protein